MGISIGSNLGQYLWPWLVLQHASSTQLSATGPQDLWPDFRFIPGFHTGSHNGSIYKHTAFEEQEKLLLCTIPNNSRKASLSILVEKQERL